MKLCKLNYKEYFGDPKSNSWELRDLILGNLNLIVGKNATGKSRTINLINNLALFIAEKRSLREGEWDIEFKMDNDNVFGYELSLKEGLVQKEIILVNGERKLNRISGKTEIFSNEKNEFIAINPPSNKLTVHSRRDEKEHPFLEDLYKWAENVRGYNFGKADPSDIFILKEVNNLINLNVVPAVIEEMNRDSLKKVINDFNSIGYDLENVESRKGKIKQLNDKIADFKFLFIKEKNINVPIDQISISKGMFAAFALLALVQHIMDMNLKDATILVDDLCEGLDYDRSMKFTKLIFNKLNKQNIQFIAASNDRFLMNAVDIEHWNVLEREKSIVKAYNYTNSKNAFDEFMFTGLNNFDLFSTGSFKE